MPYAPKWEQQEIIINNTPINGICLLRSGHSVRPTNDVYIVNYFSFSGWYIVARSVLVCLLGGGLSRGEVGDFVIIYKTEWSVSSAGRDVIWRAEFTTTSTVFREINTTECLKHESCSLNHHTTDTVHVLVLIFLSYRADWCRGGLVFGEYPEQVDLSPIVLTSSLSWISLILQSEYWYSTSKYPTTYYFQVHHHLWIVFDMRT
jgi:hypothetical protein